MLFLITYDISDKHPEVKAAMKSKKYSDSWTVNKQIYYLPNTSLWKQADNTDAVTIKAEFEEVVAALNAHISGAADKIRIEHLLAVEFTSWDGITGDEHSE